MKQFLTSVQLIRTESVLYLSILALALAGVGTGCSTTSNGFPRNSFNPKQEVQVLEDQFASSNIIAQFYANRQNMSKKDLEEERNRIINGRVALINANYRVFVTRFVSQKQRLDTATDIAVIGVNSVAALMTPTSTVQILSAVSAGVTGSKASFDKHYYYEQTVKALYAAMEAQRKVVFARILTGLKQSLAVYPIETALNDLDSLYAAGTFLGALEAIQKDAGTKEGEAQKKIDSFDKMLAAVERDYRRFLTIIEANPALARERLRVWYESLDNDSYLRAVASGGLTAILGTPPASILTNEAADPAKWLSGELPTPEQMAEWAASLNNPTGEESQLLKGQLTKILLGTN